MPRAGGRHSRPGHLAQWCLWSGQDHHGGGPRPAPRGRSPLRTPEQVGFLLRRFVEVPTGDFQDLTAWRRLTVETAIALVDELHDQLPGPVQLVVPMTLSDPGYRAESFDGLERAGLGVLEVVLTASPEVLEGRIAADVLFPVDPDRDEVARRWRWERRHQTRRLREVAPQAHCIDTTDLGPSNVAAVVARSLPPDGTGR